MKSSDPLDVRADDRRVYSSMAENLTEKKSRLLYGARSVKPNDIDRDLSGEPLTDFASKLRATSDHHETAENSNSLSMMDSLEAPNTGIASPEAGFQSFQFQVAPPQPVQPEVLIQENNIEDSESHRSLMKLQQKLQEEDDRMRLLEKLNATNSNYGSQHQLHPKQHSVSYKSQSASEIKSIDTVPTVKKDILKLPKLIHIQSGPKITDTLQQIEEVWGGISKNKIPRPKIPYGFERKDNELINIKSELQSFKTTIERTQPTAFDRKKVSLITSKKQQSLIVQPDIFLRAQFHD